MTPLSNAKPTRELEKALLIENHMDVNNSALINVKLANVDPTIEERRLSAIKNAHENDNESQNTSLGLAPHELLSDDELDAFHDDEEKHSLLDMGNTTKGGREPEKGKGKGKGKERGRGKSKSRSHISTDTLQRSLVNAELAMGGYDYDFERRNPRGKSRLPHANDLGIETSPPYGSGLFFFSFFFSFNFCFFYRPRRPRPILNEWR